ncbi:MAG: hypothetical protein ACTSVV_18650 [Promethearchaeota archaeon]
MIEISLEEFEDFYKEQIETIFFKIRRVIRKQIGNIRDILLIDLMGSLDFFERSSKEKSLDEKAQRSLNLFLDRIEKQIKEVRIPEDDDINFKTVNDLINDIKKLFNAINDIARKSLPKIQKEFQPEIKKLNYDTRKLQKKMAYLEQIIKKKYRDVKDAENLLEKIPKFFTLKENIEKAKADLDHFENELEEKKQKLEELNQKLLQLEKNELFKQLEKERNDLFQMQLKLNDQLGFKKALKKMKFELEKENIHIPNVNLNYLRDFLKNPINKLLSERKDLPNFSTLLVQLRRALEENKLNLKSETKDKTIEQINQIFEEKTIHNYLEKYRVLKEKIKKTEEKIKEKGLANQLEELKNQISTTTAKLEHIQNDLNRKNKDFLRYLGNLKQEREQFQNLLEKVIGEPVKLNITLTF